MLATPPMLKPGETLTMGPVVATPLSTALKQKAEAARKGMLAQQAEPTVTGLAGHVRKCWQAARDAKQQTVEQRMLAAVRSRRGEYDPDKLAQIVGTGGSDVYAMLTSVKCRAAASWIKDVLLSTGSERPWSIRPTPIPTLPAEVNDRIADAVAMPIAQATMAGTPPSDADIEALMMKVRDDTLSAVRKDAIKRAERMADKMEDQLVEGGFLKAMEEFVDDLTTFPSAILKGPILRKARVLKWENGVPTPSDDIKMFWERVSPFDLYPAPSASNIEDSWLIERHRLTRNDLNALIGVEGYDDEAIREVIREYGDGGLRLWLTMDTAQESAEGKATTGILSNSDGLIDALQYWGSVSGQDLLDWGVGEDEVPDPTIEYDAEVWLVGRWVIKAVLNPDPLRRKPYYMASYETVPGAFWGNSVADLVRDCQTVVNATARAMVNNMGIASGPQVAIDVSRLPPGEDITQMQPWKIWQFTRNPMSGGSEGSPVQFFQPNSNVSDLMRVFEKFTELADEYSGIPRYLTGDTTGGAGRTASGLSMLINNAGKSIKQVISNIDRMVTAPLLERLYLHNMLESDDPDLKGDVRIVALGSAAMIVKETAQVRRNEFLAATANPFDTQITGVEGRAELLRAMVKDLGVDGDKVVPPADVLAQKAMIQQIASMQQAAEPQVGGGQELMDGAPVTDNF